MKRYAMILLGLFTIAMAITIALRMTPDAMAVIVGIILGMFATIPTSLVLLYTIRQRDKQQFDPRQQQHPNQYPPVVVVNSPPNGPGYNAGPINANGGSFLPAPSGERSFKVVGQEASPTETASENFTLNSMWDEVT